MSLPGGLPADVWLHILRRCGPQATRSVASCGSRSLRLLAWRKPELWRYFALRDVPTARLTVGAHCGGGAWSREGDAQDSGEEDRDNENLLKRLRDAWGIDPAAPPAGALQAVFGAFGETLATVLAFDESVRIYEKESKRAEMQIRCDGGSLSVPSGSGSDSDARARADAGAPELQNAKQQQHVSEVELRALLYAVGKTVANNSDCNPGSSSSAPANAEVDDLTESLGTRGPADLHDLRVIPDVALALSCIRKLRRCFGAPATHVQSDHSAAFDGSAAVDAEDEIAVTLRTCFPEISHETAHRAVATATQRLAVGSYGTSITVLDIAAEMLASGELDSRKNSSRSLTHGGQSCELPPASNQVFETEVRRSCRSVLELEALLIERAHHDWPHVLSCTSTYSVVLNECCASAFAGTAGQSSSLDVDSPSDAELASFWRMLILAFTTGGFCSDMLLQNRVFCGSRTRMQVATASNIERASGYQGTSVLASNIVVGQRRGRLHSTDPMDDRSLVSFTRAMDGARHASKENLRAALTAKEFVPGGSGGGVEASSRAAIDDENVGVFRTGNCDDALVSVSTKADSSGYASHGATLFASSAGLLPFNTGGVFWFEFMPVCVGHYNHRPTKENADAMGIGLVVSKHPLVEVGKFQEQRISGHRTKAQVVLPHVSAHRRHSSAWRRLQDGALWSSLVPPEGTYVTVEQRRVPRAACANWDVGSRVGMMIDTFGNEPLWMLCINDPNVLGQSGWEVADVRRIRHDNSSASFPQTSALPAQHFVPAATLTYENSCIAVDLAADLPEEVRARPGAISKNTQFARRLGGERA